MASLQQIGAYRVVRRLGVGGMAETFEAVRELAAANDHAVCIKRVLPAYAEDASYVALFRREAKIATHLRHPNIVAVLDAGDDGQPYLVLELVDGIDLRALLATAPHRKLAPDVVAFLAMELAYALDYAHTETPERPAIVHRDLSPSNVLLSRGGDVKLADFGLAKPVHGSDATQTGTMRGKIPYLAPELMRGDAVDGRADLFALGVVLYECLAGRRPFDGAHEVETMTRVLANRRDPIRVAAPETPSALANLVESLLAHDRDDRPATAFDVIRALDEGDSPVRARVALLELVETRLGGAESRRHVRVERASTPRPRVPAPAIASTEPATARRPRPSNGTDPLGDTELVDRASLEASIAPVPTLKRAPTSRARNVRLAAAASVVLLATCGAAWAKVHVDAPGPARERASVAPRRPVREPERVEDVRPPTASDVVASAPPTPSPRTNVAPSSSPTVPPTPTTDAVADAGVAPHSPEDAPATVRVNVHPWGRVWIDGHLAGRAPRTMELGPGTHRFEGGQEAPVVSRRVHLDPGEHRTIELDLSEASAAP